jgi:uncharacterized membrane protein
MRSPRPSTPGRGAEAGRWGAIDATRGLAMVLVCLSHFLATHLHGAEWGPGAGLLHAATRLATPTFLVISGAMLGIAHASRAAPAAAVWRRFADRGLFLLLVARPLIFLAHVPHAGGVWAAARWMFVTDTIAACLLVAPGVVFTVGRRPRAALAVALFAAASWGAVSWSAASGAGQVVKEALVGDLRPRALAFPFPVLQWLSVYLVGTILGERLWEERARAASRPAALAVRAGATAIVVALAAYALHLGAPAGSLLATWTAPGTKVPPGPAFVLFYCGAGLVLLALAFEAERRGLLSRWRAVAAVLGRNSLFAFVAQYFVYYPLAMLVRPARSAASPLWFGASLALVVGAAALWERAGGYRWITVGLKPRRSSAGAAARGAPSISGELS